MALNPNTNLSAIAVKYIRYLNIPITPRILTQLLEENPYYPDFYSLCCVFNQFNIPNDLYTGTKEDLMEFKSPFAAHLHHENGQHYFVLVISINTSTVNYLDEHKKVKTISTNDFLTKWQGAIFVAEKNNVSGDKNYLKYVAEERIVKKKRNKLIFGTLVLLALFFALYLVNITSYPNHANLFNAASILSIKFFGITITLLLLFFEINSNNKFVQSICKMGVKTDCNKVLNSGASKIFGMGWNEIGFFYFASTLSFLITPGLISEVKIFYLVFANLLASPYILFSIYYQWRIVKQWCTLCVATQMILFFELLWSIENFGIFNVRHISMLNPYVIILLSICILLPIIAWYLLKPMLIKVNDLRGYKNSYRQLLNHPQVFYSLLGQQPSIPDGLKNRGIIIGEPEATNCITIITNPNCPACAEAHLVLDEILEHIKNIKLEIVFFTTADENAEDSIVSKNLLNLSANYSKDEVWAALKEWYSADEHERKKILAKNSANFGLDKQWILVNEMNQWCKKIEIPYLPFFFINGNFLPQFYSIHEVKNILLNNLLE